MLPVSSAELAQIQADTAAAVCDTSCAVLEKTTTPDGYGTNTEVWTTISPPDLLVGMAQPTASQLQNYDYVIGSLATWQVHMPVAQTVNLQNHLVIKGQTLVVQVLLEPQSYQALRTVLASEVKEQ